MAIVVGADLLELPWCDLRTHRHQIEVPFTMYTQVEPAYIRKIMLRGRRVEPNGGDLEHCGGRLRLLAPMPGQWWAFGGQQCGGFMIWVDKLGAVLGVVVRLSSSEAVRASSVAPEGCSVRPARITHGVAAPQHMLMHISTACSRR